MGTLFTGAGGSSGGGSAGSFQASSANGAYARVNVTGATSMTFYSSTATNLLITEIGFYIAQAGAVSNTTGNYVGSLNFNLSVAGQPVASMIPTFEVRGSGTVVTAVFPEWGQVPLAVPAYVPAASSVTATLSVSSGTTISSFGFFIGTIPAATLR
jgi:hypothetical protein